MYNSGPCPTLLLEGDLDPDFAQEGGGPAKPTGECPRTIRPRLGLGDALICPLDQGAQKIRGGSRPYRLRWSLSAFPPEADMLSARLDVG
jgi:hypothetical protein